MGLFDLDHIGDYDKIGELAEQLLTGTEEGKSLFGSLFASLKSKENAAECQPFIALAAQYEQMAEENRRFDSVEAEAAAMETARREYAKGGECLHRGYYSPSALDLVVKGCDRGRLLKSAAPKSYSYEYLFDVRGRLLCVHSAEGMPCVELLRYQEDTEIGFTYESSRNGMTLRTICKTLRQEGSVRRVERAYVEEAGGRLRCVELEAETPEYDAQRRMTALLHQHFIPMARLLTQHQYSFNRDEEGYLSQFSLEELGTVAAQKQHREAQWFPVLAKRK